MTTIHIQNFGDQVLLPSSELTQLLELARKSDAVQVEQTDLQITTGDIMQLAAAGASFEFWKQQGEEIYSGSEGEPIAW